MSDNNRKSNAYTRDKAIDDRVLRQAQTEAQNVEGRMTVVHAFDDYTKVTLVRSVDVQGVVIPAGSQGVIMSAWEAGPAYEVEFELPQHVVLTIEEADLRA